MSKGLEALKRIGIIHISKGGNRMFDEYLFREYKEEYNIIEKELKALEIIKKKEVNFEVFGAFETYKDYEIYYDKKFHLIENKLTEEEFNLLKEALE